MYDRDRTDILAGMEKFKFIGGTEKRLDTTAFLEMEYGTVSINYKTSAAFYTALT